MATWRSTAYYNSVRRIARRRSGGDSVRKAEGSYELPQRWRSARHEHAQRHACALGGACDLAQLETAHGVPIISIEFGCQNRRTRSCDSNDDGVHPEQLCTNGGACIATATAAHAPLRDDALDRATTTTAACTTNSNDEWRSSHCNSNCCFCTAARRHLDRATASTAACIWSGNVNERRSLHCNSISSSRTVDRATATWTAACISNSDEMNGGARTAIAEAHAQLGGDALDRATAPTAACIWSSNVNE